MEREGEGGGGAVSTRWAVKVQAWTWHDCVGPDKSFLLGADNHDITQPVQPAHSSKQWVTLTGGPLIHNLVGVFLPFGRLEGGETSERKKKRFSDKSTAVLGKRRRRKKERSAVSQGDSLKKTKQKGSGGGGGCREVRTAHCRATHSQPPPLAKTAARNSRNATSRQRSKALNINGAEPCGPPPLLPGTAAQVQGSPPPPPPPPTSPAGALPNAQCQ